MRRRRCGRASALFAALVFAAVITELLQREQRIRRELAEAHEQLRDYAAQAERLATAQERNRVARDIHDGLGHSLTVVQMQVKAARAVLPADPAKADAVLAKAQQQSEEALAEVRRSVRALREPRSTGPLPEALKALAEEISAAGVPTRLAVSGTARPLPDEAQESLYRAAQEGLTNVRKHARATRADLLLDYGEAAVRVEVRDDGTGTGDGQSPGFGLVGLRERAAHLGGRLHVDSAPGEGVHADDGGARMTRVRVLLVDDQALFREALATLLAVHDDIEVVGEAGNGDEALRRAAELAPDVVLMDLRMPVLDGIAATRRLRVEQPDVRVIALTTFDDDEDVFAALRAGAVGYLLKDVSSARLVEAVLAAARGESVLQPSVAAKVVARFAQLPDAASTPAPAAARRAAVRPRAGRAAAAGRRPQQPGDRGDAVPRRGHGQEPRDERAGQARRPRPHPGRAARPRPRPALTRHGSCLGRDPDHDLRHLAGRRRLRSDR